MSSSFAHQVRQITPFMHVGDLEATLHFLTEIIGFEAVFRTPGYAYLTLGRAALRVLESEEGAATAPLDGFRYYIDVADVDVVHAALKPGLASLPVADVMGPIDQPYRQRELIIRAPDGGCLVFGAPIEAAGA